MLDIHSQNIRFVEKIKLIHRLIQGQLLTFSSTITPDVIQNISVHVLRLKRVWFTIG